MILFVWTKAPDTNYQRKHLLLMHTSWNHVKKKLSPSCFLYVSLKVVLWIHDFGVISWRENRGQLILHKHFYTVLSVILRPMPASENLNAWFLLNLIGKFIMYIDMTLIVIMQWHDPVEELMMWMLLTVFCVPVLNFIVFCVLRQCHRRHMRSLVFYVFQEICMKVLIKPATLLR